MSENFQVVRVTTSAWNDEKGFHIRKSIRWMRRKSVGHNALEEEIDMVGSDEASRKIINLTEVEDGLYVVVIVNISRDYETGYSDDWDYKLVPYVEEKP